jgi:KDO2-lipid IV(A) lauroyltransferase
MSSKIAESIFKRLRLTHVTNAESVMPSNKIIRFVIKHKWEDRLYIFNSDQSPESSAKFAGNFLNQPTFWVTGGEAIAKKMEMPVVYLYIDRKSRSKYVIRYTSICEDGSKEKDDFILKEYARLLEKDINTNKVNWLWSHKRWKHKFE